MPIAPLRKKNIGKILLSKNLITEEQLKEALKAQEKTGDKLGRILIKSGYASEDDVFNALAFHFGLPYKKLADVEIDNELSKMVPEDIAQRFTVIPLSKKDKTLTLAMSNPADILAIDKVEIETNLKVSPVLASEKDIKAKIREYYGVFAGMEELPEAEVEETGTEEISDEEYEAQDAPIVKYVNSLFYEAVVKLASDIHLEPQEDGISLRLRIDGDLRNFPQPPKKSYLAIVSRIKITGNMDIAEKRLPQDGKCKLKIGDKRIDVRISTLPTIYGEKVVMRILDKSNVTLGLSDLGFSEKDSGKYKDILSKQHCIILVTGPTGSGKTTTLYAGLNYINQPSKNIVTVEDPVEYELKGINQVNTKPKIGLTFANILRTILRQDPDIIMVGEIRDKETAEIAIQAALTGHLVLSTLHTNDAVSSLSRLSYMGIENYLISDAVEMIIAQRLVRKICPNCKEPEEIPSNVLERLALPKGKKVEFFHGKGCGKCWNTGYKGRIGIYEILKLSNQIKKMVISERSDIDIKEQAVKEGMRTLRQVAIDKLKEGLTTVEEVLTMTMGEV